MLCALISAVYTNSTKMHRKNCWWRCCKKREKMFYHVVSWCRRLRLKRVVLHFVRCWPVVGGPFMNYVEIKMKEMLIKKLKSMDSGSDSCKMLQELNQFSSFKKLKTNRVRNKRMIWNTVSQFRRLIRSALEMRSKFLLPFKIVST